MSPSSGVLPCLSPTGNGAREPPSPQTGRCRGCDGSWGEVGSRSREGAGGLISQLGLPWSWGGGGLGAAAGLLPPPPPCSPSWEMSLPRLVGLCLNNHAVSVPPPPSLAPCSGVSKGAFPPSPQPPMLASAGKGLLLSLPLGRRGGALLGGFGIPSFPTMEQLSVQLGGAGGAGLAVTPSAAFSLVPPLPTPGRGLACRLGWVRPACLRGRQCVLPLP